MSATIMFSIPAPKIGETTPSSVVWYDSADGIVFSQVAEAQISSLSVDPGTGKFIWTAGAANEAHHQLIKTKTAGGILSAFGAILPPLPTNPTLQTLYGDVKEFGTTTWAVGDDVTMTLVSPDVSEEGIILEPIVRSTTVNSNGQFSFTPDKGVSVRIDVFDATGVRYFTKTILEISQDAARNVASY